MSIKKLIFEIFLCLGLIILFSGIFLQQKFPSYLNNIEIKNTVKKIEHSIIDANELAQKYITAYNQKREFPIAENKLAVVIFNNKNIIHWTSNLYSPNNEIAEKQFILSTPTKYLYYQNIVKDSLLFQCITPILETKESKKIGKSNVYSVPENDFEISKQKSDNSQAINIAGMQNFYLVANAFAPNFTFDHIQLFGLLIFLFSLYFWLRKKYTGTYTVPIFALILLIVEILFNSKLIFPNYAQLGIFSRVVYSSNILASNLGSLILHSALIYNLLIWLESKLIHRELSIKKNIFGFLGIGLITNIFSGIIFYSLGRLVIDSQFSFDFSELHLISTYTIYAFIPVIFGFASLFILHNISQLFYPSKFPKGFIFVIEIIVIASAGVIIFVGLNLVSAIYAVLFSIVFLVFTHSKFNVNKFVRLALRIFTPTIFIAFVLQHHIIKKEQGVRESIAIGIMNQNQKDPVSWLRKTEASLKIDNGIVDYYTCTDESKSAFEKRLQEIYFGNYAAEFEFTIFDFDAFGHNYRELNPMDYFALNTMYASNLCKPVTKNFAIINDRKFKGCYLGKFLVQTETEIYGTYFILLKPKINVQIGRLSDVFSRNPLDEIFADNQYSYAIYSGKLLNKRFGQYNYSNTLDSQEINQFYTINNFTHCKYSDNQNNVIIVSKPAPNFLQLFAIFTFILFINILWIIVYYIFIWIRQGIAQRNVRRNANIKTLRILGVMREKWPITKNRKLFLSNKIQLYVVLVVFVTFFVVLIVTVNYLNTRHKTRQREYLWGKANEIANAINSHVDAIFEGNQQGLVYDLSNYYNTDINLFKSNGKLFVTSNDRIYEQNVLGNIINPQAYEELKMRGNSGYILQEKIGDLQYISAYYTLLNNDLQVLGYLNLPYYSNQKDLYREISIYTVTLVNLFVIVFALAAILAYFISRRITEPLNFIRHQMSLVKLGHHNTEIPWDYDDEIGLLISQYNKMMRELELSTNKLAESERQGAWREMAKQVAHEIKNPLTPMKLSIQHLQYAIQRKDENLEEKLKKTSDLLIHQIDSLSRMAEEFSAFAKMPEPKVENVAINTILNQVALLFSKEENINIIYTAPEKEEIVRVDSHQLGRVFTNIVKNATQAISENAKGKIEIKTIDDKNFIVVSISDNGKGISEDLVDKIFSPNFSTKTSGMGLGLAISKKIVEEFSGQIWFESKENIGTTFFVKLPKLIA